MGVEKFQMTRLLLHLIVYFLLFHIIQLYYAIMYLCYALSLLFFSLLFVFLGLGLEGSALQF